MRERRWTVGSLVFGLAATSLVVGWYRLRACDAPIGRGHGFPLDDAWIHAQFAIEASRGAPFCFNSGVPSSGSTAPLWSLLEGAALWLVGDIVTVGHALGVFFALSTAALVVAAGRRLGLTGPAVLVASALTVTRWQLAWASWSGMEIMLTCSLLLALVAVHAKERGLDRLGWRTGLLAGALVWCRPEGLLAAGAVLVDHGVALVAARRDPARARSIGHRALGVALGWALVTTPLFAINAAIGPGALPQTVYAKVQALPLHRGLEALGTFVTRLGAGCDDRLWPLAMIGAAGWAAARRLAAPGRAPGGVAIVVMTFGWLAGTAFLRGSADYHMRYLMPLLPLICLLVAEGIALAARRLGRWAPPATVLCAAAITWSAGADLARGAETLATNVASVSGHVVTMGRWLARHAPPDAVLAMSDVGAMSALTPNRVIDVRGLVSPFHGWDTLDELDRQRRERVDLAILFPELAERVILAGEYVPVYVITLDANTISATDNLVVYRPPWADGRRLEPVGPRWDFETGTCEGWTMSGIFENGPVQAGGPGQRRVIDMDGGSWFLNSWGPRSGDGATGRALSPPFVIEGDLLTMRIGGGRRPGEVGARLWIDGRIVRSTVGPNSEVLIEREWDVRDLRGHTARVEVFDESTVGWGHVMLDRVRQWRVVSGAARRLRGVPPGGPEEPAASRRAAEARGLPAIP